MDGMRGWDVWSQCPETNAWRMVVAAMEDFLDFVSAHCLSSRLELFGVAGSEGGEIRGS